MRQEREPVRLLDAGSDCDPELRQLLDCARSTLPETAVLLALEREIAARLRATRYAHREACASRNVGMIAQVGECIRASCSDECAAGR